MQFAPQIISDCLQMFSCLVKFDKASGYLGLDMEHEQLALKAM